MGKIASDSPVPFGEAEALRLAQLLTARAMNERRREGAGEIESVAESSARLSAAPWELLPQDFKPHAWQEACLKRWLELGRGTVKVATGGGKTRFALMAAQALQHSRVPDLRVAIIVPSVPLMYQWRDEILQGSVARSDIALLGGGNATPDLANARIVIAVINSARERLPKLVEAAGWSGRLLLVVDECHRANAVQAQRVFDTNPAFTLGLSATPEQELEDEKLPPDEAYAQSAVGKALGPIIFEFSLRESVEAGLVTPFEIWHIGLPLSSDEAAEHRRLSDEISELRQALQAIHRRSRSSQNFIAWCQTQASKAGPSAADAQQFVGLANRRKRLLYAARSRVDAATALLREGLVDPEGRAIVFHEAIDETEALYAEACAIGLPAVLEHSKLPDSLRDENINLFRKGTARVIVSAKSLIEGFNVPSADLGVIAASTSSSRQRIQSLGRLLRRKQGGRTARIVVLYIRDTEDEAIYEKSDWASIVGAERNRYFEWTPSATTDADWRSGLREVDRAPRAYKPPSHEVDVSGMEMGDPYPGQTNGVELRIDQQGNARDEASAIVRLPKELVTEILSRNEVRRARITPAGHLIVRVDQERDLEPDWRYLGVADATPVPDDARQIRLRLMSSGGRRHLALEGDRGTKAVKFALSAEHGASTQADEVRRALLDWIASEEQSRGLQVRDVLWDGDGRYWIEIGGERIQFPGHGANLEFKR
jgi:superfamily II DNA or RNA helicase